MSVSIEFDDADNELDDAMMMQCFGCLNPAIGRFPHCIVQASKESLRTMLQVIKREGAIWGGQNPLVDEKGKPYTRNPSDNIEDFLLWELPENQAAVEKFGASAKLEQFTMVIDSKTTPKTLEKLYQTVKETRKHLNPYEYYRCIPLVGSWITYLNWAYVPLTDETYFAMAVTDHDQRSWIVELENRLKAVGKPFFKLTEGVGRFHWREAHGMDRLRFTGKVLFSTAESERAEGIKMRLEEPSELKLGLEEAQVKKTLETLGAIVTPSADLWQVEAIGFDDAKTEEMCTHLIPLSMPIDLIIYGNLTAKGLKQLTQIPTLVALKLAGKQFTARILEVLADCRKLRRLELTEVSIDDKGLLEIDFFRRFESLNELRIEEGSFSESNQETLRSLPYWREEEEFL